MKATAIAHPNIALVKYWGKRNIEYNLPAAGSVSLTLGGLETRTTVSFDGGIDADVVELNDNLVDQGPKYDRVAHFLDLVRNRAGIREHARVVSHNDFPTGAGLASSASGFAALAVAATHAAGLDLSDSELSALARRGSGSAARSIFGGFAEMRAGTREDGQDAYAEPICGADHWDLRCVIAVTAHGEKDISSTEGMTRTHQTSPYYDQWVDSVSLDVEWARAAIEQRDFDELARIAEASCLRMHASAMAAEPGIIYWNGTTVDLIHRVRKARKEGLPVFFTIDAGPQVKVFCPAESQTDCELLLRDTDGVRDVLVTHPGEGARLIEETD
ncbi:diphosphomevalonate decarboxylase [Persicimonas caeni]|uniref:diphosphomevalonate decarboxylase n=1 Tax=Persicimonas caeni TaxID=2292766 RepID=A0A4Y6PY55_PERCE|nr:diphosphomevalonate decarboxylase [Persicimonas caeni]QDG53262.1 diphosphomevalonate decarboxylase [Persicimonas caeni]QED34484.1 diphosphomevalonate decarboxylase [Persicimonas caeni]